MARRIVMLILYAVVLVTLAACGASRNEVKVDSCAAGGELCLAESTEMLVDPRDGQIYKTVKIGNQIWMAENLNYETARIKKAKINMYCGDGFGATDCSFFAVMGTSFCYDDHISNCAKYGRLYMWNSATEACPEGWHLPDTTEWKTLFATVGGMSVAGKVLKSTFDWNYGGDGTDEYGFSVLPSGASSLDESFYGTSLVTYESEYWSAPYDFFAKSEYAGFWSSIEKNENNAYSVTLSYYRDDAGLGSDYKRSGFSVRCVKNEQTYEQQNSSSSMKTTMKNEGSSSSATLSPSVKFPPSAVLEGTFTDKRDGRKYKTVTIGSQTLMAENLNYDILGSYCFGDDSSKCTKYGRLYTWEAAKNACPAGSHLPRKGEWMCLFNNEGWPNDEIMLTQSGTEIVYGVNDSSLVGKVLKSKSGWHGGGNGTDDYGFSVLPAGFRYGNNGAYSAEGNFAIFWSSDSLFENKKDAYAVNLSYYHDKVDMYKESKDMGLSVRCVLDETQVAKVVSPSDVVRGTFVDSRDGRKYNTVTIGSQTWMAENLNYGTANSYCFNDDPDKCAEYGRFYTWAAAMDSAAMFGVNGEGCGYNSTCKALWVYPVQGVCPAGFHLPTTYEWKILFSAVGGKISAGKMLKSTMGWEKNGTDDYGFSAIPVGRSSFESETYFESSVANFWSVDDDGRANSVSLDKDEDARFDREDARNRFSVRCVKDEKSKSGFVHPSSVVKDSVIDSRDGQAYKTVTIGLQTWMAENLNYEVQGSYCYLDSVEYCSKYGRFYTWTIAKDVCPAGFHLPSKAEWETLIESAGGEVYAYTLLKSRIETIEKDLSRNGTIGKNFLWYGNVAGRDDYGFTAFPVGCRSSDGNFEEENKYVASDAHFWSSTESDSRDSAYSMDFKRDVEWSIEGSFADFKNVLRTLLKQRDKNYAVPVRCVKD